MSTFTATCLDLACTCRSSPQPTRAAAEHWIDTHAGFAHPGTRPTGRIEEHEPEDHHEHGGEA